MNTIIRPHYSIDERSEKFATDLGTKRSASMGHSDTINSRNFFPDKPPQYRHIVGVKGELVVSWWNIERGRNWLVDTKTIGRGDRGTDFPCGIQVKTSTHDTPPDLILDPVQYRRKRAEAKIYILVWLKSERQAIIMGWITTKEIEANWKPQKTKFGERIIVPLSELKPMESLDERLKKELQQMPELASMR